MEKCEGSTSTREELPKENLNTPEVTLLVKPTEEHVTQEKFTLKSPGRNDFESRQAANWHARDWKTAKICLWKVPDSFSSKNSKV